ncbi:uncharacterized protein ACHE_80688A [Aspergillus chevalieri]|uniref:Uncharacterized protein n=1 Tax=Aspergillus chevalieri TaxID=182096 RepID=A0A7R7VXV9_ASPCH|nr:uncharacterized protein ACHE_80688A [Aspergillus chevalieri]BCR92788.1 hypothetical protein ACHE_80688A [Aspergillus chevalieri]
MFKRLASSSQQASRVVQRRRPQLRTPLVQPPPTAPPAAAATVQFSTRPALHTTKKDAGFSHSEDFDRTALDPKRNEGTKSGTDSEVAQHRAAYDPSQTSPESEMQEMGEETKQEGVPANPLDVSGANQEVNRSRDPREGMADRNADREGHSTRGVTPKNREVKTRPSK